MYIYLKKSLVLIYCFQSLLSSILHCQKCQRQQFDQDVVRDRTEAVRIAKLKYEAGSIDLLSVLQLQNDQLASQGELIKLNNAQLANRINLHLALGGSFEVAPAVAPVLAGRAAAGSVSAK